MGTVYSYARLVTASAMAFWGLWLLLRSSMEPILGIVIGGVGLAVALIETAYVFARFMRASPDALK